MKRNSLVVLGLSAVLGFGLLGIGCSDDSKPAAKTDGGTDAKTDALATGGAKSTGGTTGESEPSCVIHITNRTVSPLE